MSDRKNCEHIFGNGHRCGSPAQLGDTHCYYHRRYKREQIFGDPDYEMPSMNDRHGLKLLMNDILRSTMAGRMNPRIARTVLWGATMAHSVIREIEKQERSESKRRQRSE